MATSQNGWTVFTSPPSATIPGYITGRVRPEDVDTIFTYLCERLNREVENVRPEWSWGWAFRAVRGATSGFSNHASATAIDVNAPAHPLGVTGTWSQTEKDKIHAILRDLGGIVRWGEDYTSRKDGMHFEINDTPARVNSVAVRIRSGNMPDQKPEWKPRAARAVHFGRVQEQFLIAAGVQKGELERKNGVGLIQRALNKVLELDLEVDGYVGESTLNAWGRWEDRVGVVGRPRIPDRKSVEELAELADLKIVGEPWDEPVEDKNPDLPLTIERVAKEVIEGKWGDGDERKAKLEKAGYDYKKVQAKVVKLLEA